MRDMLMDSTNVCGVAISDGWMATLVIGGALVLIMLVLVGLAEWSTRRYVRNTRYLPTVRRRAGESWRPPEAREEEPDDGK